MVNSNISVQHEFQYLLDWRLYLPINSESKLAYVGESGEGVKLFFERIGVKSVSTFETVLQLENSDHIFDMVALPYGFAGNPNTSSNLFSDTQLYKSIKKKTHKDSQILIGFSRKKDKFSYFRLKSILHRVNLDLISSYGLLLDLYTPEYIFPLSPKEIGFVIRHRYHRRYSRFVLNLLTNSLFTLILSNFLPAYFVVVKHR